MFAYLLADAMRSDLQVCAVCWTVVLGISLPKARHILVVNPMIECWVR
jgi:hypothetical protein